MTLQEANPELTIALFAGYLLSQGKAAELAQLPGAEFQMHLGACHIGSHYDEADAHEDAAMLASQLNPSQSFTRSSTCFS